MFIHHDPCVHVLLPLQHMTREEITRMAQEAGFVGFDGENKCLREFAALVAEREREACARVCDELSDKHTWEGCYADECAQAIRARGQT